MFSNKLCIVIVANIYDTHVKLPTTDSEYEAEIRGFLENYEFTCVGAWDGFHVKVSSKFKSYFSFFKDKISTESSFSCSVQRLEFFLTLFEDIIFKHFIETHF